MCKYEVACPNDHKHRWFLVASESGQTWMADPQGNFIKLSEGDDAEPGFEDRWICRTCGAEVQFLELSNQEG